MGAIARTQPQTTAVARHDPLATPLGQMIAPYEAQLTPFLRNGVTLERVAAELVLMARGMPQLMECRAEALVDAVSKGLALGAMFGRDAWIVPFKVKGDMQPTLMTHYKFEAELVVNAGGARGFTCDAVYDDELDTFRVRGGSDPGIDHSPAIVPKKGRKLVGAYCVAHMGQHHTRISKWVPLEKIESVRKKSREWNPDKCPACPDWWAIKYAFRQCVKLLPKNANLPKVVDLIERQERAEFGDDVAVTLERPDTVDEHGVDLTYDDEIPVALPNDGTVRHVDADIAAALAYPMPGKPESWGGYGGKPLGECPLSVLTGAREWAIRQAEKERGYAKADVLEHMCTVVIEHMAKQEQEAAVSESAEVFGEGHLGAVLPGEVEASRAEAGELPLGDTRPSRSRNAIAEGR